MMVMMIYEGLKKKSDSPDGLVYVYLLDIVMDLALEPHL